jgi:alcohol dehydrogenase
VYAVPSQVGQHDSSTAARSLRLRGGTPQIVDERLACDSDRLMRPRLVAVCSLDVALVRAGGDSPGALCHAAVGTFAAMPDRLLPGITTAARRVVTGAAVPCGTCVWCGRGLASVCPARRFPGASEPGYAATAAAVAEHAYAVLPISVSDGAGLFAPFAAAAAEAVQRAEVSEQDYVTVLGDGVIGLLAAQIAARRNPRVRLLGKHAERFSLCERWGIKHRHVREAGKRRDQDVVIDCTGRPGGLIDAIAIVRPGGRIVMKAPPCVQPGQVGGEFAYSAVIAAMGDRVELIGAGSGTLTEGVKLLAMRTIDTAALLSKRYPLSQARQAFSAAADHANIVVGLEIDSNAGTPGTVDACESV